MRRLERDPCPKCLKSDKVKNSLKELCAKNKAGDRIKSDHIEGHYKHPEVHALLQLQQHRKCVYCEDDYNSNRGGKGEVDHFRPKADGDDGPRYWFLAYDWENLVLACSNCNGSKLDQFPLKPPGRRARSKAELKKERPLLLNPYDDDYQVEKHFSLDARSPITNGRIPLSRERSGIKAVDALIQPRGGCARAAKTIEIFKLNDGFLDEDSEPVVHSLCYKRRERLADAVNVLKGVLGMRKSIGLASKTVIDKARRDLEAKVGQTACFCGFVHLAFGKDITRCRRILTQALQGGAGKKTPKAKSKTRPAKQR